MPPSGSAPSLSVVMPHYRQPEELVRTLRAVEMQVYPSDLVEVVVVDDGSPGFSAQALHDGRFDLNLRVLEQPRDGFGLARARNRGADAADGEVLVFLDCDMLPVPRFLEAHAALHRRCDQAVVIGARAHIDLDVQSSHEVLEALSRSPDKLGSALGRENTGEPAWRRRLLHEWRDFEEPGAAPYRVASGGNLSVRSDRYAEFGKTSERFRRWGGEDTEFAYRAWQRGARFAYSRRALAWHQGLSGAISSDERQAQRLQEGLLADLVPLAPFRPLSTAHRHSVPKLWLRIGATHAEPLTMRGWLTDLLRSWPDVAVSIEAANPAVQQILDEAFRAEQRIMMAQTGSSPGPRDAPIRGLIPEFDGTQSVLFIGKACSSLLADDGSKVGYSHQGSSVWKTRAESRLASTSGGTQVADLLDPVDGAELPDASEGPADAEIDVDALRRAYWAMPRNLRRAAVRLAKAFGERT